MYDWPLDLHYDALHEIDHVEAAEIVGSTGGGVSVAFSVFFHEKATENGDYRAVRIGGLVSQYFLYHCLMVVHFSKTSASKAIPSQWASSNIMPI